MGLSVVQNENAMLTVRIIPWGRIDRFIKKMEALFYVKGTDSRRAWRYGE